MGEFFEYFSLVEGVNLGGNPEFGHSRSCPRGVTNSLRVILSMIIALQHCRQYSAPRLEALPVGQWPPNDTHQLN